MELLITKSSITGSGIVKLHENYLDIPKILGITKEEYNGYKVCYFIIYTLSCWKLK